MAYVEAAGRTRISPVGVATAIGMNALFLVGIASIGPNVGAEDYQTSTITNYVEDVDPPKPPVQKKDIEKLPVKPPPVSTPTTNDFVPPLPPIDLTDRIKIDIPPIPPTPDFVEIKPPSLPPAPTPVLVAPRYDTRYAAAMQPDYPSDMAHSETEGTAVVRVLVGTDGRVKQVEDVRSDHSSFFESTRKQALNKWRFKPATRDGVPYESWREMRVYFRMPNRFD